MTSRAVKVNLTLTSTKANAPRVTTSNITDNKASDTIGHERSHRQQ